MFEHSDDNVLRSRFRHRIASTNELETEEGGKPVTGAGSQTMMLNDDVNAAIIADGEGNHDVQPGTIGYRSAHNNQALPDIELQSDWNGLSAQVPPPFPAEQQPTGHGLVEFAPRNMCEVESNHTPTSLDTARRRRKVAGVGIHFEQPPATFGAKVEQAPATSIEQHPTKLKMDEVVTDAPSQDPRIKVCWIYLSVFIITSYKDEEGKTR